jgi:tetratricopeptide (TPR) repeat protein
LTRKRFALLFIALLLLQQDLVQQAALAKECSSTIAAAESVCHKKVSAWTASPGDNSDYIAVALESLAALYSGNGRNDDAISKYKEALAVRERAPKQSDSFIALTQTKLADCLTQGYHDEESEPLLLAAYTTQAKLLGKDNPEIQKTKRKLAVCYLEQKKFASAEILFKELLQTSKDRIDVSQYALPWKSQLCYAGQLTDLTDCYMRQKKWDIAIPLSEQLLFIYPDHGHML